MLPPTSVKTFADAPLFRHFPRWVGAFIIGIGLLTIVSWYAHWQRILQLIPDTAPMQFNTALCFVFSGAALFLLTTSWVKIVPWLGGAGGLIATFTLLEYLTNRDLYVDLIFYKPYFQAASSYLGRMSPLAAASFIFIGAAIVMASLSQRWRHRLAVTGLLACIVGVIGLVALFGYVFGIDSAYGWGAYSRMALNTAIAFVLLSNGLLVWAWQTARREKYNFLRWLPITGSVTLMTMVAFVSTMNMTDLKNATFWRKHTIQVIFAGQSFLDNLIDIQRGARGYMTMGDTNALVSYQSSSRLESKQFNRLVELTHDNQSQQKRLKDLADAMNDVFNYDTRMIAIYNQKGFTAVSKTDVTGENRVVFGHARDILKAFSQEEQHLLDLRDATEQADYHNAARLMVFGSVLAAVLLIIGNLMASREMQLRQRAEKRLTETLTLQNAILHSANYAIIALDQNGVVKTFNPAAERMLGYTATEVIGKATPLLWRDPEEIKARAENIAAELDHPIQSGMEILLARARLGTLDENEVTYIRKDGHRFPVLVSLTALADVNGTITGFLSIVGDISERKQRESEREKMIVELQQVLTEVKTLSGLIPICGWCKNVRSDQGFWHTVEDYVRAHTDASFSHGICPACSEKFKADARNANLKEIKSPVSRI